MDTEIRLLPTKPRGRPVLLVTDLEAKVQMYLRKVREGGGAVSSRIASAAARGILLKYDKTKLAEFGGHVHLTRHWAHSLLKRMNFVKRKATTSKSKQTAADFGEMKASFLADVVSTVAMEEIPPELILNWDQTGIKIVPCSTWTMDQRGAQRVEMVGVNDKRQITALFCGTMVGDFLPVQLVYKGTTPRCHPHFEFPSRWHVTHSKKHWSNEETMVQYDECIIIPYIEIIRENLGEHKPALAIFDNFKAQLTDAVTNLLDDNDIHICLLPPNTTDRLQPLDISVNKPAKDFLKRKFDEWYTEQVMKLLDAQDTTDIATAQLEPIDLSLSVLKEVGAQWLVDMAQYFSNNPDIVVSGFFRAGITGALSSELQEVQEQGVNSEQESVSEYEFGDSDQDV